MGEKRFIREMLKKGVEVTDFDRLHLRCKSCGTSWSPNIQSGGRLPRGYWKCPNECNYTKTFRPS